MQRNPSLKNSYSLFLSLSLRAAYRRQDRHLQLAFLQRWHVAALGLMQMTGVSRLPATQMHDRLKFRRMCVGKHKGRISPLFNEDLTNTNGSKK
ncbi:hypothetical protein CDAR_523431 [Caerostris darwini]|uniref:Secreted protein n=1 Tax=Caerostris darwini TaxID=1538125 RepID=A0AAV4QLQ2_9ARAC|nr:hypothetical protein CDAR_523431 [Caerostris darwini]